MKKNSGFTLIELLGIIVLLGVIIAIIVPKMSTTIEKGKQKSAIDSGLAYIKATRDYYNVNILENDLILKSGKNYVKDIDSYIDVKGDRPLSGYLTISKDKIVYAKLCINYYEVIYQSNDANVTGECDGTEEIKATEYTSYVDGASKAYIYIAPEVYDTEASITDKKPPMNTLIIYVDSDDKVLSAHWGYVFKTTDLTTIQNYNSLLYSTFSSLIPDIDNSHYYVLEEISILYLIEHNTYMNFEVQSTINYTNPLATVLDNLNSTFFGGDILTTTYKIIEFEKN